VGTTGQPSRGASSRRLRTSLVRIRGNEYIRHEEGQCAENVNGEFPFVFQELNADAGEGAKLKGPLGGWIYDIRGEQSRRDDEDSDLDDLDEPEEETRLASNWNDIIENGEPVSAEAVFNKIWTQEMWECILEATNQSLESARLYVRRENDFRELSLGELKSYIGKRKFPLNTNI